MLAQLSISNYALIRALEINPASGFNVITGETGAGKSILLGAVGLLMGKRADTKVLFEEDKKCIVEGSFFIKNLQLESLFEILDLDYDDSECIIRRVINPNGKSRAFVNDQPVTLEVLKQLSERLLDIHSQHDTLKLANSGFQLEIIDSFASVDNEKRNYSIAFEQFKNAQSAYNELKNRAEEIKKEQDFNQFQFDELQTINIVEAEDQNLTDELSVLENAEDIKQRLSESMFLLSDDEHSVLDKLKHVSQQINAITKVSKEYQELSDRIDTNIIDLKDIASEISGLQEGVEHDPQAIQYKRDRLDKIIQLQHKHGVDSIEELLDIQTNLDKQLQLSSSLDDELSKLKKEMETKLEALMSAANKLSKKRQTCFEELQTKISGIIKDLGMPEGVFKVEREQTELSKSGQDKIFFLFSANKGIATQPISQVASGGEFSRLMFSLKFVLAEKSVMPTLIFDEIETGISGEVAFKMLEMIKSIAKKYQIISISHLPQFAAGGDHHYFVFKDHSSSRSVSLIKRLNDVERIEEISKMIGGANPSAGAIENAKELLSQMNH